MERRVRARAEPEPDLNDFEAESGSAPSEEEVDDNESGSESAPESDAADDPGDTVSLTNYYGIYTMATDGHLGRKRWLIFNR